LADIILPVNTKLEEDDSAGDIFSGQAVFEPDVDQCTEDAKVKVVKVGNGKVHEATTDSYGDFWLRDVEPGEYPILVEKDGYLPQKMGVWTRARTSTSAISRAGPLTTDLIAFRASRKVSSGPRYESCPIAPPPAEGAASTSGE
jgi:hypothetical protein